VAQEKGNVPAMLSIISKQSPKLRRFDFEASVQVSLPHLGELQNIGSGGVVSFWLPTEKRRQIPFSWIPQLNEGWNHRNRHH
jgi:hypothetical protein